MSRIDHIEPAASAASTAGIKALATTLSGGSLASLGGLASNEAAMWGGLFIGLLGLAMQWHFGRERNRREEERRAEERAEHLARMSELRDGD